MLNAIALTFASGAPFFAGLVLVQLGALWSPLAKRRLSRSLLDVGLLLGAGAVALSATPLPIALYVVWGSIAATARLRAYITHMRVRKGIAAASLCAFAVMFFAEARYWRTPTMPMPANQELYVVGDSISIGSDEQALNWPERLAAELGVTAHNYSFGGAKVRTALSNAKRIEDAQAFIILEIGGNDVLAGTDTGAFHADLEELMRTVCAPGREVVMFELPLPSFHNRYGRIQRTLANKYGVTLIPKHIFAEILAAPNATIDGLHLSRSGHELMANRVAELFTQSR